MGIHRVVVVSLMFDHDHHTSTYVRTRYCMYTMYIYVLVITPLTGLFHRYMK